MSSLYGGRDLLSASQPKSATVALSSGIDTRKLRAAVAKDLSYNHHNKEAYHNAAKAVLRKVATAIGVRTEERDIRSCKGGIAVAGEVTLHTEGLYLQIRPNSHLPFDVMFRSCQGRKDYTGGPNHWAHIVDLENESFIAKLARIHQGLEQ